MNLPTQQQLFLIVIVLAALAVVLGPAAWWVVRRRQGVWRQFARRRGLSYVSSPTGPRVTGKLHDRLVDVRTAQEGSDEEAGVVVVRVAVQLRGLPEGMTAEAKPGLIGGLAALAEARVRIGDDHFDRDVIVNGPEQPVRAYWTAGRRTVFLRLTESTRCDRLGIEGSNLFAEFRSILTDVAQLEEILDRLLTAAGSFDEPGLRDTDTVRHPHEDV